ncbi:MAG: DNA mismatch repair endonuclease MutL [Spirochaetia bacterium]|jgi:DNA mismatch repair protein MutL|nr:DNA mismatch repair endonuclease MutL [Spirochaetia bacterium]
MKETPRIRLLSDNITSKISAGEVVEAPFSVVKELVENSLDAGALRVDVQLLQSGLKKISVSDNGSGILREDVTLAIKDHATSKISDVFDIESISTYGFRGEALSSIASISDITLLTRHETEETGTRLYSKNGKTELSDWAGPVGTTVIVENLFYNIPARKKFLKSPQTELRYARDAFLMAAAANPFVSFTLDTDQKRSLNIIAVDSLKERLQQVYGNETADNCYFEELKDIKAALFGMLSKPDFLKASRSVQKLFINGRPVDYKYLSFLLSKAYESVAPKGKYPAAILFLEIAPELVDVNIHPAKREVKLFDNRYVDSLILQLAGKALSKVHSINEAVFTPVYNPEEKPKPASAVNYDTGLFNARAQAVQLRDIGQLYNDIVRPKDYLVFGTLFDTYMLVQKAESLYVIDFHAAHERLIYDELRKKKPDSDKQELLFPVILELPIADFHIVTDNMSVFSKIGFDMEEFSDNTITIRALPAPLGKFDGKALLRELIAEIRSEKEPEKIYNSIAAVSACHAANRAGDTLSQREMELLTDKIFSGEYELRCPHGRPFVHIIKKEDLERIFKR